MSSPHMPYCPECGTEVKDTDDYCGNCGEDVSNESGDKPSHTDSGAVATTTTHQTDEGAAVTNGQTDGGTNVTKEQITDRVKEKREQESGGIADRLKGVGYGVLGLICLGLGYWAGFVGYTETTTGPEGFGVYQVTHPIIGLILIIFGGLSLLAGLGYLAGMDLEE